MKTKILIAFIGFTALSFSSQATTKTLKKAEFTIHKDSTSWQKPDTVLQQQNIVFPNPFIVFPANDKYSCL